MIGPAPLSFAQQRLWFLDRLRPMDSTYNLTHLLYLRGPLDVPALERAVNEIRRRHDVLRANVDTIDDQPVQVVAPYQAVPLTVVDLSTLPDAARERACEQAIDAYALPPFNLASDPLIRLALMRRGPADHVLVVAMHHIISDGWSTRLFTRECAELYDAFSQGKPSPLADLPIQYSDYARRQRERLRGPLLESLLSYWTAQLEGGVTSLELPSDRPRTNAQASSGGRVRRIVPPELHHALQALGRRHESTLFMTVLATLQILLHRLSGQPHVIVGTPVAGRTHLDIETLLGMFVNTLPIRITFAADDTFATVLARVRTVMLDALRYQELPFEKLVEELHPERSLTQTPLFQVMINAFLLENPDLRAGELTIESRPRPSHESKFDLTVYVQQLQHDLSIELRYKAELFDAAHMEEMLDQFFLLLRQVAAAPARTIGSYTLVSEHARRLLPDPATPLREPTCAPVADLFRASVTRFPTADAVVQGDRAWTYEEVGRRAGAIARTLVACGVRTGHVVAVTGPRSVGLVTSVVGVAMSGGVVMPVDRRLPANRQQLMLTEATVRRLLYVGEWRAQDDWLREVPGLEIVAIPAHADCPDTNPGVALPVISPDDPAYIFFTSGTTGVPKGVLGCQKGLSHFLAWQRTTFDVGPGDRCAQLTSLSFEVFLRDIFLPLTTGAALYLPDEAADPASDRMLPWMAHHGITLFHSVPTLAHAWLETDAGVARLGQLRWAFFGGEPLSDVVVQKWRERMSGGGRVVNLYGPAETTLAKCFFVIPDAPSYGIQPLGIPLPNTQALVLNGEGQPCGVGEPGEIVIRTPFRTLGYVNAPDEQRKRFVRNALAEHSNDLLYLTGDRGRYRADGVLEFLGRIDDQVKIRGVRVEPAEVTAVLGRHPRVNACCVIAVTNPQHGHVLVAYVVPAEADRGLQRELRAYLREHLPAVMVPSAFVLLDALPVTSNGKIDRRALPPPDLAIPDITVVAPRTPAEHSLHQIWCRVLRRTQIGVQENFFDLGGHSLTAAQLVSHIRWEFNVEIALEAVFAKPTIESLALCVLEQKALASDSGCVDDLLTEVESLSEERAEHEARYVAPGGVAKGS